MVYGQSDDDTWFFQLEQTFIYKYEDISILKAKNYREGRLYQKPNFWKVTFWLTEALWLVVGIGSWDGPSYLTVWIWQVVGGVGGCVSFMSSPCVRCAKTGVGLILRHFLHELIPEFILHCRWLKTAGETKEWAPICWWIFWDVSGHSHSRSLYDRRIPEISIHGGSSHSRDQYTCSSWCELPWTPGRFVVVRTVRRLSNNLGSTIYTFPRSSFPSSPI